MLARGFFLAALFSATVPAQARTWPMHGIFQVSSEDLAEHYCSLVGQTSAEGANFRFQLEGEQHVSNFIATFATGTAIPSTVPYVDYSLDGKTILYFDVVEIYLAKNKGEQVMSGWARTDGLPAPFFAKIQQLAGSAERLEASSWPFRQSVSAIGLYAALGDFQNCLYGQRS